MNSKLKVLLAFFLLFVACAWGLTRTNNLAIWNSTIDNTPIGQTSGNTGQFTTISSLAAVTNSQFVNGKASSYAGAIANASAFNIEGGGDADFIAANGGASPKFNWYYQLGPGSPTKIMFVDPTGILNEPYGINANVNGNLTGTAASSTNALNATFATTAGTTSGNSATATQFAASPTNCGTKFSNGISQNGNALCNASFQVESVVVTSGICTTGGSAGATCSFAVTWPNAFPSTAYAPHCSAAPPSGSGSAPSLNVYVGSKTTSGATVTLQGGQGSSGGTNTTSEVDCTAVMGNN